MEICAVTLFGNAAMTGAKAKPNLRKCHKNQSGRSKWSRKQPQNSNAIDRFFSGVLKVV